MKLSDLTPEEWLTRLDRRRSDNLAKIRARWDYYEGTQPLYYVAKILEEQADRFPALTINWCAKFIDMIDRRCTVEGFRLRGKDSLSDDLWEIWQRNDLDESQSENNIAALVTGDSALMVTPNQDGQAFISVEPMEQVAVELDPRTGEVIAGAKWWKSDPNETTEDRAELWLPSRRVDFENSKRVADSSQAWMASQQLAQGSSTIPFIPFPNRPLKRIGRTELAPLIPIVDAANQSATNMMAGVEHHAVPRKWALGVSKKDFVDTEGNPVPTWKIATGAIWASPYDKDNPDADPKIGQFAASDLRNFHETLGVLARIGAGLCDLPPNAFGFGVSENPPSADSIRASQDDWISRIERVHLNRGGCYERAMRLAGMIEGQDATGLSRLETVWRDPSTPTQESKARSAAAAFGAGISDLRQAREDAGYSKTQIDDMEARERTERTQHPVTQAVLDRMSRADGNGAQPVSR